MATKIINYDCNHEGQDKLHGKGKRVMNSVDKAPLPTYRCTVCGKEKRV